MTIITIDNPTKIPALTELKMLLHLKYYYNIYVPTEHHPVNYSTLPNNAAWNFWRLYDATVRRILEADAVGEFNHIVFENWYDSKPALEFAAKHLKEGDE